MPLPTTTLTPPSDTNDYSKIFSTNGSSTPFTWLDADYLKGWDIVGSVPPARTQFNALQRMTDEKLKALKAYTEFQKQYNAYLKSCSDYLDNVKAPINSPTFTGDPKAPTPAKNDNDTSIATTAFVQTWVVDLTAQINAAKAAADEAQNAATAAQNTANQAKDSIAGMKCSINFKVINFIGFELNTNGELSAMFRVSWTASNNAQNIGCAGFCWGAGAHSIPHRGEGTVGVPIGTDALDLSSAVATGWLSIPTHDVKVSAVVNGNGCLPGVWSGTWQVKSGKISQVPYEEPTNTATFSGDDIG